MIYDPDLLSGIPVAVIDAAQDVAQWFDAENIKDWQLMGLQPVQEWVATTQRRPTRGRLIVKKWKNGSVWAGVYSGTDKDSSFDEWCYLP